MADKEIKDKKTCDSGIAGKKKDSDIVYKVSAVIAIIIAGFSIIFNSQFTVVANAARDFLQVNFEGLYLYSVAAFFIFSLVLAFSKFGKVRLGGPDERPEYSTISWFGMLFTAGMGVGLVFWGVTEPMCHYLNPWAELQPMTDASAAFGIRSAFMHWGALAWGCYAIAALALAYFMFARNKPCLISTTLEPLFGKSVNGGFGKAIDIYVTILTCIGVAVAFGMGTLQAASGLEYVFGIPSNVVSWLVIVIIVAIVVIWSTVAGISKGIKRVSNTTLFLSVVMMVLAFIIGPRMDMLSTMVASTGDYLINLFPDALKMESDGSKTWIFNWRIFFWAFWVSWAPFVGTFIARVSRGRTIREFVLAVIIVPTIFAIIWFSIFGTMGFHVVDMFSEEQLRTMIQSPETMMFIIFDKYPLAMPLSIIAVVDVLLYFITSANSGTFVLAMFSSNGDMNPPKNKRIFWGVLLSAIGFGLILGGGIGVAQTTIIVFGFLFIFIMALMAVSLVKALREDSKMEKEGKSVEAKAETSEVIES